MERMGQITSEPDQIREGLFGGVILFVLEVLPSLQKRGMRPGWDINTSCYGNVIPSLLEPVTPLFEDGSSVSLDSVREHEVHAMGGDFESISQLWRSYFRPKRGVLDAADEIDPGLENAIGVHYRGGDKLKAAWDTNPIKRLDFLRILEDRIEGDPSIDRCLVTGDDAVFIAMAKDRLRLPLTALSPGEAHKDIRSDDQAQRGAILAFRDCILLSRCRAILQTSSALPSFAKVLRPEVDCQRCAASKWFGEVPYFPVAYIPVYESTNPDLQAIIRKAMVGDWSTEPEASRVCEDMAFMTRADVRRPVARRGWWKNFLGR